MRDTTTREDKRQEVCKEENVRRVSLPGGEILINARRELLELAITSGLQVMEAMFREDVEALCGPRYSHLIERDAFRWGRASGEVTLGGRKIQIERPRVRKKNGDEVPIPTYEDLKSEDPLKERVLEEFT